MFFKSSFIFATIRKKKKIKTNELIKDFTDWSIISWFRIFGSSEDPDMSEKLSNTNKKCFK